MSSYLQKQVFDETQLMTGKKLELQDLIRLQINRCNTTAGDPMYFNRNVEMLANMLPSGRLAQLESPDLKKLYMVEQEVWVYRYFGNTKLGSPERPFYINDENDPNWDGGEKIMVSPIRSKQYIVNYDRMFTIVLRLLEECGLSWKQENVQIEGGRVDFDEQPDLETPHPTYTGGKK
jgi:hypothetical protein